MPQQLKLSEWKAHMAAITYDQQDLANDFAEMLIQVNELADALRKLESDMKIVKKTIRADMNLQTLALEAVDTKLCSMNKGLNDRLRRCELRSAGYVVFRRPPGWDVEDSEGALVLDSETGSTPSDVSDLESAMSLCSEQEGEINERLDSALIVPPRQDADAVPSAPSDCRDNVDVSLPTPSIHSDPPGLVPAAHRAIGGPLQVPSGLLNQSPSSEF